MFFSDFPGKSLKKIAIWGAFFYFLSLWKLFLLCFSPCGSFFYHVGFFPPFFSMWGAFFRLAPSTKNSAGAHVWMTEYKLCHTDEQWSKLSHRIDTTINLLRKAFTLYPSQLSILKNKWNDLKNLKSVIPAEFHTFYDGLPKKKQCFFLYIRIIKNDSSTVELFCTIV